MKNLSIFLCLAILVSCSKDKNCSPGFTGSDCDQELTPQYIKLNSVSLLSFPPTDNGAGWDLLDGPDVYFVLLYNSTVIYSTKDTRYTNAISGPLLWDIQTNVNFDHPADAYVLAAYDYDDTSADDFMGAINFVPYIANKGFPTSITWDCAGCSTQWKTLINYVH
ncbi:MAG: hypothetical protein V9E90_01370 [Saprospiraceae bacterium]